jgi:glycosyltransferase involved in cell wall biosynthesis
VRIGRVIAKLEPGGAQLSLLRVARELRAHGVETRLLAGWATPEGVALARDHGFEPEVWNEGGNLQWVPDPRFPVWLAPRLEGVDLVHAHMFGGWWAAARAVANGTPLVASEHNAYRWPDGPHGAAMLAALQRVDVFYAHGPEARATVLAYGLPPERVRDGVSPVQGTDALPLPGLPEPRIVFAGRLAPDKGPDVLVEALGLLRDPPATLVVGDGRLRPALEQRVDELGLSDRVHFLGWVGDPGPYIAGSAVLAMPSREEAVSQTAMIGLALGVPVIGTEVDGFPATIGAGRGILVPPDDPAAFARALDGVLSGAVPRPRPLREIAERHAPARVAALYESTYRALAAAASAGARAVS